MKSKDLLYLYPRTTLSQTVGKPAIISWRAFLCPLRMFIWRLRTPVWSVNAPTAVCEWCSSTGKAEPFYFMENTTYHFIKSIYI